MGLEIAVRGGAQHSGATVCDDGLVADLGARGGRSLASRCSSSTLPVQEAYGDVGAGRHQATYDPDNVSTATELVPA